MPFSQTRFPGLAVYEPVLFNDERGYFFESYNANTLKAAGINLDFVQDNQARSVYGVVRGLHYQLNPHAQTKFIRVLEGMILDVAVDMRSGSPTFGQVFKILLSAVNKKQLLIPKGFAHGYAVLSPTAEILYKCDAFYHKTSEAGVIYNDPSLDIDWGIPMDEAIISAKDRQLPHFSEASNNFDFVEVPAKKDKMIANPV